MTALQLFNTLTRKKELFAPLKPPTVFIYTCGPTVYDFAHIGNFRTYVFEDLLRRTLKHFGFKVTQVMNLTDVDDKTIRGATKQGVSLDAYTNPFIEAFFADGKTLGIEAVEHYPRATEFISEMTQMIQKLIDKGNAYVGKDGSVYYNIRSFPHYGCLSHFKLDDLEEGAGGRVSQDEYDKENASDFVLWKSYDSTRDGEIYWESPFGKGRPGWHLECSTMAMQLLGETLDIHVGGVDNMFPHHENEIAQSEACSGKTFSRFWLHTEHLLVGNRKMSKSLGNFYTLRDLLSKGFSGREVRYILLSTHYKTQLNFTLEGVEGARHTLQRIDAFIDRLQQQTASHPVTQTKRLAVAKEQFDAALADDLNISAALAALFDLIRDINSAIDSGIAGREDAEKTLALLKEMNAVLNVMQFEQTTEIPQEVEEALKKRTDARAQKEWKEADKWRAFIEERGFVIEDSAGGSRVKKR